MLTCRNTSCWQSCECCNTFLSSLWQPLLALTRSTEHGRHVACALLGTSRNTSLALLASSSGTSSCHSYNYIWSRATCKYYARYLGLGMRYDAGICTVKISMKNDFLKMNFNIGHIFVKKRTQPMAIYILGICIRIIASHARRGCMRSLATCLRA